MDESPFSRPEIMDGYPLSKEEREACETVKTRNVFKPRWWQFRLRYRTRRFRRDAAKQEERLISLIGKERYDEMNRKLERQTLIGPGDGI